MRNIMLCGLLVLVAVLWWGCCDPVRTASQTIDRTTRATMTAEAGYKRLARERLLKIAEEERDKRTSELAKAGCPLSATASQPAGLSAPCQQLVAQAQARYDGRKGKLVVAATKLDASTALVYGALLAAVEVLELAQNGLKTKLPELATLVARAADIARVFLVAYEGFKKAAPTY